MESLMDLINDFIKNNAFWGCLGTAVGGLISYKTTVYANKSDVGLHREERKQRAAIQYHRLQMDELLLLQELVNKWGRAFVQYYLSVEKNISCKEDKQLLPFGDAELDEKMRELFTEIVQHASRVMNDDLRDEIEKSVQISSEPADTAEFSSFYLQRFAVLDAVQKRIGSEYRRHLRAISPVSEDEV